MMDGLTPEQENAIAEWLDEPGRTAQTAEEAKWAELASAVESFTEAADDLMDAIDWLGELGVGGDMSALRDAVLMGWEKFAPPDDGRSLEDLS